MTSIAAASSSSYLTPLQKLQQELQAEVASGKISSTDQSALSSALTDIDGSIQAGRSSDSSTKASPGDLKSKIDDLISGEVSSGKLTSDQANDLKDVFKAAFAGGAGGAGGTGRAGGPPPGPPPSDSDDTDSTDSTDSTTATSPADLLKQLLASLQESLSASSSSSYSAKGTAATASSSGSSFTALLIDYQS